MPATMAPSLVIFTTLDGPLRDVRSSGGGPARNAIAVLADQGIPLVLVGRGSADDMFSVQHELGLRHPFVCDRGTAVYVPHAYFTELTGLTEPCGDWDVIPFPQAHSGVQGVRLLIALYRSYFDDAVVVGLGDCWEDRELLHEVDVPIVVRSDAPDQDQLRRRLPTAYVTRASGPAGWSEAILGSVVEEA
jgi:predicted mannosyl-3-phosphoglycerate phosphatase (HAD superfamily)